MSDVKKWTFLTNHAMVLNMISRRPSTTACQISAVVGIQERSVRRIIADLVEAGYVVVQKEGRSNRYLIREHMPLRRSSARAIEVGDLLRILDPVRRQGL